MSKSINAFGHDIEVLTRVERNVDTSHFADFVGPHPRRNNDLFTGCVALLAFFGFPIDAGDFAVGLMDFRDLCPFEGLGTSLACAFGQGLRDVGRIALSI